MGKRHAGGLPQRTHLVYTPSSSVPKKGAPMQTILLSEPDADTARRYANSLQRAGFRVELTTPGVEREDLIPDLVVLSVARLERSLLRVVANGRAVPRIVISSASDDAARALEFDCAAVLVRPVMYDDLITAVRRAVNRSSVEAVI